MLEWSEETLLSKDLNEERMEVMQIPLQTSWPPR